jgi:hypothetical protein
MRFWDNCEPSLKLNELPMEILVYLVTYKLFDLAEIDHLGAITPSEFGEDDTSGEMRK